MSLRSSTLLGIFFLATTGFAQQHDYEAVQFVGGPYFPCVLTTDGSEVSLEALYDHLSARESVGETSNTVRSNSGTATFDVTYTGFTPAAEAAFQHAVDLWAARIQSSIDIRVEATFDSLAPNVLGAAGPNSILRDFTGAPESNVWYVDALADALHGSDLGPAHADIVATFNSEFANWYLGTDGNPGGGEFDFVSVVLHELGHGLGFLGSASVDDVSGEGSWGVSGFPIIYDLPVEDGDGTSILNETEYPNPSIVLGDTLQGNDLHSNSPGVIAGNEDGVRGKLYAPASWLQGSSYSHWDESTYPGGSLNALMTPAIAPGEALHEPGPMTCGLFEDIGWVRGPDCPLTIAVEASPEALADVLSVPRPNPARGVSTFTVAVEQPQRVSVDVFDTMGRRVQALYDGALAAGMGERLSVDASVLPAGIYVVRATGEDFIETRRVTVVR